MQYFYTFRDLFAKLTAEEIEAGWSDEHDEDIPNFGDSQSSYEDVKFYCNNVNSWVTVQKNSVLFVACRLLDHSMHFGKHFVQSNHLDGLMSMIQEEQDVAE